MTSLSCKLRLVFANRKAVHAMAYAIQEVRDMRESQPWNPELRKIKKALRYAVRNMKAEVK